MRPYMQVVALPEHAAGARSHSVRIRHDVRRRVVGGVEFLFEALLFHEHLAAYVGGGRGK